MIQCPLIICGHAFMINTPFQSIVLATQNTGKILELQALLAPITGIPQSVFDIPFIAETGLSFVENAILKARHVSYHTKAPALADDSGLMVDALLGSPGIYSARYAGEDADDAANMAKLLEALQNVPEALRGAHFYCALAIVRHAADPAPIIAVGQCHGRIGFTPRGTHGFGYDPLFYLPEQACTFAELSPLVKNTLSHRAQALKSLQSCLHSLFE